MSRGLIATRLVSDKQRMRLGGKIMIGNKNGGTVVLGISESLNCSLDVHLNFRSRHYDLSHSIIAR